MLLVPLGCSDVGVLPAEPPSTCVLTTNIFPHHRHSITGSPILSLDSDPRMPQPSSSTGSWHRGCIPRDEPCDGKGLPHYTQCRNLWHKLSVEGPGKVPFCGTSLGQLSPMTHSMGETKVQPRGPQGYRIQVAWDCCSTRRRASSPTTSGVSITALEWLCGCNCCLGCRSPMGTFSSWLLSCCFHF